MSSSKQLNFFIVPEDWPSINAFFKDHNVKFIVEPLDNKLELLSEDAILRESPFQLYLTKSDFQSSIVIEELDNGLFINILRSNCIQFSKGGFYPNSKKKLHRGRFYAVTKYYDEKGELVNKDEDFIKYVDLVFKSFKRTFLIKTSISSYHFSESAKSWVDKNSGKIDKAELTVTID